MDSWSVFYKVRKAIFGFIAICSLVWGAFLSVYLAHMWAHLVLAQRIMFLAVVGANGLTALMLYLMAVVVFRVWMDLARVAFLFLIHVAGAVVFMLFGEKFTCDTYKTKAVCDRLDLAFVVGSWVMAGLLLGYALYLLCMLRIPRPAPKLSLNPYIEAPPPSRRDSTTSFDSATSATGLLQANVPWRTDPARTTIRRQSLGDYSSSNIPTRSRQMAVVSGNYGAMGTPRGVRMPISPITVYPATPKTTPASFPPSSDVPTTARSAAQQAILRSPFLQNPFADPLSRLNTPLTAVSQYTFSINSNPLMYYPPVGTTPPLFPSYSINPTQDFSASLAPAESSPPLYSPYDQMWQYSSSATPVNDEKPHLKLTLNTSIAAGPVPRHHTTTPHSIHSVAPSMHFTDPIPIPVPPVPALSPAHVRAYSNDPIYRPHTAAPTSTVTIDRDAPLPNPFPMVGSAEVRRFGSVPSAQFHTGQGGAYRHARSASHLAGAEAAVPDREQWRRLVFTAATGRTL